MLASAVFFYGSGSTGTESPASLFDAYDLIRDSVGKREPGQVVRNELIN
jgi:metal iron transporter